MAAGSKFCPAGEWTPMYQGPSFGFVYITNASTITARFNWRAYSANLPFYSSGDSSVNVGEKKTIGYGLPTPYVQFEVNPSVGIFLFGS